MLLNVSELRDYVMTARMVAEITWDAPAIYSKPDAAERYTRWWAHEYFEGTAGTSASADVESAYTQYFSLLKTPDTMWSAEETVQDLLEQLYHKVAGEAVHPVAPEKIAALRLRAPLLDAALATEARAERVLPMSRQRFLHEDVALGLIVDQKQTQAALKLNDALSADPQHVWPLVMQAREPLEQLEAELMRGEYPPFDRWYHETWIRPALGRTNPHRSYSQLRAFIASEGHGHLEKMPPPPAPALRPRP
jgi:hypothetical protein